MQSAAAAAVLRWHLTTPIHLRYLITYILFNVNQNPPRPPRMLITSLSLEPRLAGFADPARVRDLEILHANAEVSIQ